MDFNQSENSRPRTVAWLINGDERYGVRQALLQLTLSVRERGWKTPLIALHDGPCVKECRERGFEVHSLNVGICPRLAGSMLAKPMELWKLGLFQRRVAPMVTAVLKEISAEAMQTLWPNLVQLAGISAKRCGIPTFWEMPNIVGSRYFLGWNRWLYQAACWRNDITPLANSHATAATLGSWPVRPIVAYLGVDSERFNPGNVRGVTRDELGIPEEAIVFGIVARVTPSKGQDWALRSMLALGVQKRPLHLVLLGGATDEAYIDELRTIATEAKAADRLHILGNIGDPERYYPLMDIPINGRVDIEPFGLSVIEAMMMERPVLVHAFGGPAETVIDGKTGWYVREPTERAMIAGMRRVLSDQEQWEDMGQQARQHAIEFFSKECQARNYMKIVEKMLNR